MTCTSPSHSSTSLSGAELPKTSEPQSQTKPSCETAPLLAPKPFLEMTPEEFRAYVESLYVAPKPKAAPKAKKPAKAKPPAGLSVTLTKKGAVSVRCKRKQKHLTQAEFEYFAARTGAPLNVLYNGLKAKGFVFFATQEQLERAQKQVEEIPW